MKAQLEDLLTQEQVDALPDGAKVVIRWSGGNGPWVYTLRNTKGVAWAEGSLGVHVGFIDFVSTEHKSLTQVSLYTGNA